jgi:hypothetical protein
MSAPRHVAPPLIGRLGWAPLRGREHSTESPFSFPSEPPGPPVCAFDVPESSVLPHYLRRRNQVHVVIILGIALHLAGLLLKVSALWTAGIAVFLIGLALTVMGAMGRAVGGQPHLLLSRATTTRHRVVATNRSLS